MVPSPDRRQRTLYDTACVSPIMFYPFPAQMFELCVLAPVALQQVSPFSSCTRLDLT